MTKKICEICGKIYEPNPLIPVSDMWCDECYYQAMEDLKS